MTAANEATSTGTPAAVTFDTLAAVQTLRTAGLEDRQAEAIVTTINRAMSETVATKADLLVQGTGIRSEIAATRSDLKAQGAELRAALETQRTELKAEIAKTSAALENRGTELKAEIANTNAAWKRRGPN